jgi:hypothetical protein
LAGHTNPLVNIKPNFYYPSVRNCGGCILNKPNSVRCAHCDKPTGMFAEDGAFINQLRHSGEVHINELTPEEWGQPRLE